MLAPAFPSIGVSPSLLSAGTARLDASGGAALVLAPDRFWFLTEGEVVVQRAGRPIEVWPAPAPLDLAGTVRATRDVTFVALGGAVALGVPRAALAGEELAVALAQESARLWARIEADARRDDDMFLPWARPVPGPWWFRKARAAVLVMQGERKRLDACLPRGVRSLPGTGGRYVIALTRFEGAGTAADDDAGGFAYHEVTPFLPVWSGLAGPAAFVPELYPDAWMAMLLGREIHGFPKRTARVGFRDDGGELIVDRRVALRARWRGREPVDAFAAVGALAAAVSGHAGVASITSKLAAFLDGRVRPSLPVLVHKRIGAAASSGATCSIDELVRVPVGVDPIARAERLTGATVELADGVGVLHGSLVEAWYLESGLRFGPGRRERRGS